MITRRAFVLTAAIGLLANASRPTLAEPASANDPRSIVNAIYTRAALGKGDGGGGFLTASKSARARNLSQSLATLWLRADAHTPKGDVAPIDFDPVTTGSPEAVARTTLFGSWFTAFTAICSSFVSMVS